MVVFEGKAFDEKKVVTIETNSCNEVRLEMTGDIQLFWHYKTQKEAISKVNEIAALINIREEQLLKLAKI